MKGFLRKVMMIASFGAALTFFGCQKDYTDDINKVRDDLTAALEEQNQALTDAINSLREEAQQYADAAEKAAKEYADAAAQAAQAAAIEEAERLAEDALNAAKEYADNAAKEAAAAAKAEVLEEIQEDLEQVLSDAKTYTDQEISALRGELEQKIQELSSRIEGVASELNTLKSEVEKMGGQINDLLAFKELAESRLKALEDYRNEVEAFIEEAGKELESLRNDLTDLAAQHDKDITDLTGRIDSLRADFEAQIDSINTLIAEIQGDIIRIDSLIEDLYGEVAAVESALNDYKVLVEQKLEALKSELESAIAAGDQAVKEELLKKISDEIELLDQALREYFTTELAEMEKEFNASIEEVKKDLEDKYIELKGDIADIKLKIKDINDQISAINGALIGLEEKIGSRLTSVSLIPELYLDGVPAFWLESISYPTITLDPETELAEINRDEYFSAPGAATKLRYHLSPAHVTTDGIANAEYLIELAQVITKAPGNVSLKVVSYEVNEETNELEVYVVKNSGESLIEETEAALWESEYYIHTAALRLEIASDLLYEGETEAYVTSEYSAMLERTSGIHIKPAAAECTEEHPASYSLTYADAIAAAPVKVLDFGGEIDLTTLVAACMYSREMGDLTIEELTEEDLAASGLEFRFEIPTAENLYDGVNQQQFIKFTDDAKTTVTSSIPEGQDEFDQAFPVIRVEIIDTNNEDAIVDVQWFKLRFKNKLIPEVDLGAVHTFNGLLGCVDFVNILDWADIQEDILNNIGKVNEEGVPAGVSFEDFQKYYRTDDGMFTYQVDGKANVTFDWTATDYTAATPVITWTYTIAELGNVIDEILENGSVTKSVTIIISPRSDMEEYAGDITFELELVITLEDLPKIYGWNNTLSWTDQEGHTLAEIDPVGYSDRTNTNPGVAEFVRYNFNMYSLFNANDENGNNFITNIIPTADQIAAYAEREINLEDLWKCRRWDMQFATGQPGLPFEYTFASQPSDWGMFTNSDGHYLRRAGQGESTVWFDTPVNPWYTSAPATFTARLSDFETKDYEGSKMLVNDVEELENGAERKTVAVNVWSRINEWNYYPVHSFDIWFMSPVDIPFPEVEGEFKDVNMNSQTITLPHGQPQGVVDFQNMPVDTDAKYAYYRVEDYAWDADNILVDVLEVQEEDGFNIVVDPSLNANDETDRLKMSTVEECHFEVEFDAVTGELTVTNNTGQSLTTTCHLWIKLTLKHAYGEKELWYPIAYSPISR